MATGESVKARAGNNRKVLRKCAAVAANKIKLMSDVEENSTSESVCSGRKLPHRNASAVARKKLLHNSEDDQSLKSELEEEELKDQLSPLSNSLAAQNTENGDSESESDLRVARKNWHANGYKSQIPATSKTKFLKIASSEEDSKSHDSDNGHNRTAGPSTSLPKLKAEGISEEEEKANSETRKYSSGKYSTGLKNAPFLKKAKIFSDSEYSESDKEDGQDRCRKMEMNSSSGNVKCEPVARSQCFSDHVSETDLDSDDDKKAKEKPNSFIKGNSKHLTLVHCYLIIAFFYPHGIFLCHLLSVHVMHSPFIFFLCVYCYWLLSTFSVAHVTGSLSLAIFNRDFTSYIDNGDIVSAMDSRKAEASIYKLLVIIV